MKHFLSIVPGLALGFSCLAADPPAAPSPAAAPAKEPAGQIQFDSTAFNFGKVKSGEVVKHDFIFTNVGKGTLEILEVKPGCGCTTAGAWDKKVEPGNTGRIPLQFNSTGFGGQVSKSATVTCNDSVRSNYFLIISGTVWKPIDLSPSMAMFNFSSDAQTNETKVIRIISNVEEPVQISDLKCPNPAFKPELVEVKPGKEFELKVTAQPPFTNPTVYATITMKTSCSQASNLMVTAYAMVQQPVTVMPQQVVVPPGPLANPYTSAVSVRNTTTNNLVLSDARLDFPGAEVKVQEVQPGHLFTLSATFPAGFKLPPGQRLELTVKSDHPKFPLIKVPIYQNQAAASQMPVPAASPLPGGLRPASPVRPAPAVKPTVSAGAAKS